MPSDSFAAEADRIRQRVMDTLLSAFSALSEGLLIVDRDARIVWMNEQYPATWASPTRPRRLASRSKT